VYDAAYLAELKANTASRPLPTAEGEYQDMDVDMHNIPVSAVDPTDADGPSCRFLPYPRLTVCSETSIPSASSITAAKQRRERMRAAPAESEDYISLSLTKRDDVPQGPHPESRLMREDDELGEGDDGKKRFDTRVRCLWDTRILGVHRCPGADSTRQEV
jgi:GC-rich sequence DNA-binding factor